MASERDTGERKPYEVDMSPVDGDPLLRLSGSVCSLFVLDLRERQLYPFESFVSRTSLACLSRSSPFALGL